MFLVIGGATSTWTSFTSGSWNNPGNWSPAGIPFGSTTQALKFMGTDTFSWTATNVSNPFRLQSITLDSPTATDLDTIGTTNGITLANILSNSITQANAGPFFISNPLTLSGPTALNGDGTGAVTLTGAISGPASAAITKSGASTFVLTGNNSFSGPVALNGGILSIARENHLGDGSATNVLSFNGGTLQSTAPSLTLGAARKIALTGSGAIDVPNTNVLTVPGAITGSGGLTKTSSGTLILNGLNTYSGTTTINAGVVQLSTLVSVGNPGFETPVLTGAAFQYGAPGSPWVFSTGSAGVTSGGGFTFNAGNPNGLQACMIQNSAGGIGSASQAISFAHDGFYQLNYLAEGRAPAFGPNPIRVLIDGVQVGTAYTPGAGFVAAPTVVFTTTAGTHILTFTGAGAQGDLSSYIDDVSLADFTGSQTSPSLSPASALVLSGATAVLDVNGLIASAGSLSGVTGSTVALGGGTLTIGGNNTSTAFNGTISDAGGVNPGTGGKLIKVGTGTLTLNGTETYSGGTTLSAGTLRGIVAGLGSINVASGTVLFPGVAPAIPTLGETTYPGLANDEIMAGSNAAFDAGSSLFIVTTQSAGVFSSRLNLSGGATITSGAKLTIGVQAGNFGGVNIPILTGTVASITNSFTLTKPLPPGWSVKYLAGGVNGSPVTPSVATPADTIVIGTTNVSVTPVKIAAFGARVEGAGVTVSWTAVSEFQNAGFNVYRRNCGAGFQPAHSESEWTRINPALIAGRITNADEKQYAFYDWAPAGRFEYRLEGVGILNDREFFYPETDAVTIDWNAAQAAAELSARSFDAAAASSAVDSSVREAFAARTQFAALPRANSGGLVCSTLIYSADGMLQHAFVLRNDAASNAEVVVRQSGISDSRLPTPDSRNSDSRSYEANARWFSGSSAQSAASFTGAKIVYSAPGVLLIPQASLPAGFNIDHVALQREGRTLVPLALTPGGLVVFGQGYQDDYTDKDAIFARRISGPTSAGQIARASGLFNAGQSVNTDTPAIVTADYHDLYFDFQMRPYTFAPWFSNKYLTADSAAGTAQNFTLATPFASAGAASLTVNVWSLTSSETVAQDHALQVLVNGVSAGQAVWGGGNKMVQLTFQVPSGALAAGTNQIQLVTPPVAGVDTQICFLHSMTMSYTRQLNGSAPVTVINLAGGAKVYELNSLPGPDAWVVDARFPDRAALVPFESKQAADGTYTLRFSANSGGTGEFKVVPFGQENAPIAVSKRIVRPVKSAAGVYWAVGPSQFSAAIQPLLTLRAKEGLRGSFLDQETLFDYYNHGRYGPAGIQKAVRALRPQYLALLGRTTYDYRNYSGLNVDPLCPAFLVSTSFWSQATSDSMFGDLGRGYPEVAVGRLPANNATELSTIVRRVVNYTGAPISGVRVHAVADELDKGVADFAAQADALSGNVPGMAWQKNYLGVTHASSPEVYSAMTAAANGGADWIVYVGHGNASRLGRFDPRILEVKTVTAWTGSAVLLQATCTANWSAANVSDFKSIAIQALTQPQGGISASIASSTYMNPDCNAEFMGRLMKTADAGGMRWGSALMKSQQWAYQKSGSGAANAGYYADLSKTEQIFGDPAMPVLMKGRPAPAAPLAPVGTGSNGGTPAAGTF